jgi:CheY-like chemotaxis protein
VALPAPSGGPKKVLIVDDDAATRQLIAEYLRKQGFAPIHASGGLEALAAARRERPAAITLDVLMPGMDGWAVLNALKAEPGLADIPVVMVSFLDDQRMGYALGAAEYLTKPINSGQLAAVLKRFTADPATASVLIVDDDAPTRELLRRRVEELGCSVREAENGRVGLERLRERAPGIILLDLMMPEIDGFQFVEAMREHEAWRHIPVAIITAKDLSNDERQRLNGQVVSVLHKNGTCCDTLLPDIVNLMRTMTGPERPVHPSATP